MSRSRSGRCSQRRSNRPPIGVAVRSKTPARVSSAEPAMLSSSSRLRRVAGSMISAASRSSVVIDSRCGRADFCVSRTYASKAPAAAMAKGLSAQPKPARSRVRNCSVRARVAESISKCHGARDLHGRSSPAEVRVRAGCAPSGAKISAGRSRSTSASKDSRFASSMTLKRPADRSSHASP